MTSLTKAELRAAGLAYRKNLGADEVSRLSHILSTWFFSHFRAERIGTLHSFLPIARQHEPDTWPLLKKLWHDYPSVRTVVPRSHLDTREMDSIVVGPWTEFHTNKLHIPEPREGHTLDPQEIDLVLLPCLGWDRRGYRVGYGQGFYDRFLVRCRPNVVKVGFTFAGPAQGLISDTTVLDVPMDLCIWPGGVASFE